DEGEDVAVQIQQPGGSKGQREHAPTNVGWAGRFDVRDGHLVVLVVGSTDRGDGSRWTLQLAILPLLLLKVWCRYTWRRDEPPGPDGCGGFPASAHPLMSARVQERLAFGVPFQHDEVGTRADR